MSQEGYQPTQEEIEKAEGSMSTLEKNMSYIREREMYEKIKQDFLDDIRTLLEKIDPAFYISEREIHSIALNGNNEISGEIRAMEVEYSGHRKYENGREERFLDSETVLKTIAFILKKKGVKVYDDNGRLIVVERPKDGYENGDFYPVNLLYSRGGWGAVQNAGRASVFSDGLADGYYYKEGKLMYREYNKKDGNIDKSIPEWTDYEINEFEVSEEDVVKFGEDRKKQLNISSSSLHF